MEVNTVILYTPTPTNFYEDYICHHGIKGQKWGVRHGPPYPLDPTVKVRAYSKKEFGRNPYTKYVKTKKFHDQQVGYALDERNSVEEVESRILRSNGEEIFPSPAQVIRDFARDKGTNPYPTTATREGFAYSAQKTNPGYGERGTTNNCLRTSVAVELRNRGYDVIGARSHHTAAIFEPETWFKGALTKGYSTAEECRRDILKQGEGASGVLGGFYGEGMGSGSGGHALHYWVHDRTVKVQDGQSGKCFNTFTDAWNYYGFDKGPCSATRLDDCEPDWDAMMDDSVIGINNRSRRWKQNGNVYRYF